MYEQDRWSGLKFLLGVQVINLLIIMDFYNLEEIMLWIQILYFLSCIDCLIEFSIFNTHYLFTNKLLKCLSNLHHLHLQYHQLFQIKVLNLSEFLQSNLWTFPKIIYHHLIISKVLNEMFQYLLEFSFELKSWMNSSQGHGCPQLLPKIYC